MTATAREATELLETALVEAAGELDLLADIHLRLAGLMRFVDGVERGLDHAELAVAAARRTGDPVLRCRALASAGLLRFNAGKGVPEAEMEEALSLERSLPDWPIDGGPRVRLVRISSCGRESPSGGAGFSTSSSGRSAPGATFPAR